MWRRLTWCIAILLLCSHMVYASVFGQIQGVVHDAQHRPVKGARVQLHAVHSDSVQITQTTDDGRFSFPAVALGEYVVTVSQTGFGVLEQSLSLASNTSPTLHFELQVGSVRESVSVSSKALGDVDSVTPTTTVGRMDIARTPGADRTNGLQMITDFVPGAYMTHDMLHVRGGHQVSWLIDGVTIPNTNIGSNLGAQIDPKDIDYLEVQRGSYTADLGDRTFGIFNVVPRTGFERNKEAEVVLSFGNFLQTNDQLNFGDHTQRFAYYASLNGNRSDYGLAPPVVQVRHDAANGYGGFGSFLYNRSAKDQLRSVVQLRSDYFQIPYDPDPSSAENQQYQTSGLRDGQHETDGLGDFSWVHTYKASIVTQISPFFHYNKATYSSNPADTPVATTSDRSSNYAGLQASVTGQTARNTLQAGIYSFGQRDKYRLAALPSLRLQSSSGSGGLVEEFISDNYKVNRWFTLIGGVRESYFAGDLTEAATAPRVGAAVEIPKLHWVFRGFYGRSYQPPPLLTATGPILDYAQSQNTTFQALRGERDEEHQIGVQIPYRGWVVDADTFKTRARNFLDHSNVGESSLYYPVTIDGALIQGWELTLRSPQLWRFGRAHVAYSNQVAKQRGGITGGLVCYPISSPDCSANFNYVPVDHDQRNTLTVGYDAELASHTYVSTNVYYGSGFHNGSPIPGSRYPGAYLPQHTSVDISAGKRIGENTTLSANVLNLTGRRVLLDNSLTFGGFHYNDPREIYGEVRFRFHY